MGQLNVDIDPNECFVSGSGFCTLKFKVSETNLKRELIAILTGMPAVAQNEDQAKAIAEFEDFLASNVGKPYEFGVEFGVMYLNHMPARLDPTRLENMVEFIRQHPEVVEFDNLRPLRERLKEYTGLLRHWLGKLEELDLLMQPEQKNHPVKLPPKPQHNGHVPQIESGG